MMNPLNKYVLISPCRDEAKFMRETLDSSYRPIHQAREIDYRR